MANRPLRLKSGRVLDEALIDKLAAEAERGYDLSKARRVYLRPGRPAKGEPSGESPRVSSRVPAGVYAAAKARAEGEGLTISDVVREQLAAYAAGPRRRKARALT
jgi:hypothetical protein